MCACEGVLVRVGGCSRDLKEPFRYNIDRFEIICIRIMISMEINLHEGASFLGWGGEGEGERAFE